MNKELLTIALAFGCIAANANTNNYDLLGRKGSKMNSPMVYKNVDYSKTKKNEQQKLNSSLENRGLAKQAVGLKGNAKAIIGMSSPKRYGFKVCESGQGCGSITTAPLWMKSLSLSQYLTEANKYFIPVYTDNRPTNNNDYIYDWIDGATLTGYSGYTLSEAPYDMPQNEFLSHSSYETINNLLFRNNEANSNVGVYMAEKGLPVRLNPWTEANVPFIIADNNAVIQSFSTTVGHEMDASRMYKLLHRFSDRSVVYSTKTRPSNPAEHRLGPQIYMGVHGYGGSAMTRYNATAKNLDNYIYNNRTVEIVAAGDKANKLSAEGFAVNAITVGAIDSKTGNVASYSGKGVAVDDWYVEGEYVKPDIHNYTKFYMDDFRRKYSYPSSSRDPYDYKPFYDSTRSAAGVTAGMVSNMLSKNEFYRWHPEVVKAVMLNAKNAKHLNYEGLVFKKQTTLKDHEYQHLSMYFIGDVNTLMKDNNHDYYFPGKVGKSFVISLSNSDLASLFGVSPDRIDGIRVALSWLNSGNDIERLGDVPQKFGVFIFTQHGVNANYYLREWASSLEDGRIEYRLYENYPYRYAKAWGYAGANPDNFDKVRAPNYKIQIVLEDDDSRSENYGQMALGVDIMPLIYDK